MCVCDVLRVSVYVSVGCLLTGCVRSPHAQERTLQSAVDLDNLPREGPMTIKGQKRWAVLEEGATLVPLVLCVCVSCMLGCGVCVCVNCVLSTRVLCVCVCDVVCVCLLRFLLTPQIRCGGTTSRRRRRRARRAARSLYGGAPSTTSITYAVALCVECKCVCGVCVCVLCVFCVFERSKRCLA